MIYATDVTNKGEYKIVSVFPEIGIYIAEKNTLSIEINQIEAAMYEIKSINPLFSFQLAERYYNLLTVSVPTFSIEELEYIKMLNDNNTSLKVVYDPNWGPMEYYDSYNDEYKGIFSDIYKQISNYSGLKFEFVKTNDYYESLDTIKNH